MPFVLIDRFLCVKMQGCVIQLFTFAAFDLIIASVILVSLQ